jgi:hypothetical protein
VSASLTAGSAREGLRPHTYRLVAPITADPGRKVYSSGPDSKCHTEWARVHPIAGYASQYLGLS